MKEKNRGIAILGSTGSGKTSISIALAQEFGGEIISCDSMQIYKGMPIGTAQPSPFESSQVPYHLVDEFDVNQPYSANIFLGLADAAVKKIRQGGKLPLLAGGTGMYASFFIYGFDHFPADPQVREQLKCAHRAGEEEALLAELKLRDPATYELHKLNWRRALRALEICQITGKTLEQSKIEQPPAIGEGFSQYVLMYSPEVLRQRKIGRAHV